MFSQAQEYCFHAVNSINSTRKKLPYFQDQLNKKIEIAKASAHVQSMSYKALVQFVIKETKENVKNDGDTLDNLNSVAWHLGISCYIARNSCPAANGEFEKLFVECWEYIHSKIGQLDTFAILHKSCNRLMQRHGDIYLPTVEAEVINQACLWIIENYGSELNTNPDVTRIDPSANFRFQEIAVSFADAAIKLFPNQYTEREKNVAILAILQNISWSGMWDFLCKYFLTKHGIQLDNEKSGDGFIVFNSTRHERLQNGYIVSESEIERVIELSFTNDKNRLFVSIEPTLSGKPGNLIEQNDNVLIYRGDDPDFEFTVYFDEFEEVEKFILHRTDRDLQLIYY